jgi:hypothetical protein
MEYLYWFAGTVIFLLVVLTILGLFFRENKKVQFVYKTIRIISHLSKYIKLQNHGHMSNFKAILNNEQAYKLLLNDIIRPISVSNIGYDPVQIFEFFKKNIVEWATLHQIYSKMECLSYNTFNPKFDEKQSNYLHKNIQIINEMHPVETPELSWNYMQILDKYGLNVLLKADIASVPNLNWTLESVDSKILFIENELDIWLGEGSNPIYKNTYLEKLKEQKIILISKNEMPIDKNINPIDINYTNRNKNKDGWKRTRGLNYEEIKELNYFLEENSNPEKLLLAFQELNKNSSHKIKGYLYLEYLIEKGVFNEKIILISKTAKSKCNFLAKNLNFEISEPTVSKYNQEELKEIRIENEPLFIITTDKHKLLSVN